MTQPGVGRTGLLRISASAVAECAFWLGRPAFRYCVVLMVVVGAVGAMVPTGVTGERAGAGVLGGSTWGLTAGLVLWPLLAALACAASITDRHETGLAQVSTLTGITGRAQVAAQLLGVAAATAVAVPVAAVSGGVVGLGDAVRQQTSPLGAAHELPNLGEIVLVGVYLLLVIGSTASWSRRRMRCFGALAASLIAFLSLIAATRSQGGWTWLARIWPWAPLWAPLHPIKDEYWLHVSVRQSIVICLGWALVAVLVIGWSTRPGRRIR